MAAFPPERKMHSPTTFLNPQRRQRLLRHSAWLSAALVLLVICLSAFLRQSNAGLGCAPWPACHARAAAGEPPQDASGPAQRGARALHRVSATSLLLLLLAVAALARTSRPRSGGQLRLALIALALVLFLAGLGPFTSGSRLPAVTLGNLLGGFLLFAVCVRLGLPPAASRTGEVGRLRRWAWAAVALLLAQSALGGLISAGYAGLSCPELLGCHPGAQGWLSLNPWQIPDTGAGLPRYAGGTGVQWLHRLGTLAVLVAVLGLARAAWHSGRRTAALAPVALVLLQAQLGIALALGGLPLGAALAHNLLAALLLAVVAALLPRGRPLSPRL
jgi:cytochrome c oxidase assembly protein subunit 15